MAALERPIPWQAGRTSTLASRALVTAALPDTVVAANGATLALEHELAIDDPAYRVLRGRLAVPGGAAGAFPSSSISTRTADRSSSSGCVRLRMASSR